MARVTRPVARWAAPGAVVAATLIAFLPVLSNGFIDWDDQANFVTNLAFRGFGWAQFTWMVTAFHLGVYQPLAWLAASVEFAIGGLDPWVYHAGSWLLHAAMAAMVYVVARRLLAGPTVDAVRVRVGAAMAALLWALHPLRVEAVAWASAQGYPLAGVFVLASITAYLRACAAPDSERARWRRWSIGAAVLAYLAKPVAVTLPLVLLLLDWYPLRRFARGSVDRPVALWIEKLPYAIPAALVAALAPLARARLGTIENDYRLGARLAQAAYGLALYLIKTVAPVGLSFYVPLASDLDPFEPRFLASTLAVVGLAAAAWGLRRVVPAVASALGCYAVLLLPVLGLVPQGVQLVADRYAYFAGVPIAILAGAGALEVWRRLGNRRGALAVGACAAVLLLVALGESTWRYATVWRNFETLIRHSASVDPLRFWAQEVALNPRSASAHNQLGVALAATGRHAEAIEHFEAASARDPANANARLNAGLALARLDRIDEAIAAYRDGLALRPEDATAHAHLGDLLARRRDLAGAESEYRRALSLVAHPDLFNSLGVVLAEQGRYAEAAAAFREALRLDPTHVDAGPNLEMALAEIARIGASGASDPGPGR